MTKHSHWFQYRPHTRLTWRGLHRWIAYFFGTRGFWRDLYECYHRARYGWAPSDVWSLDSYLADVMASTIHHLAKTSHGAPCGYPDPNGGQFSPDGDAPVTHFDQWYDDLRRDARALEDYNWWHREGMIGDFPSNEAFFAVERWIQHRQRKAMAHMAEWYGGLWD